MKTEQIEKIFREGAISYQVDPTNSNHIKCVDGFTLSVIAGPGAYCHPRPEFTDTAYKGPYTKVEVALTSERPEPWGDWVEYAENVDFPTKTIYPYVPIDMVRDLVKLHGGEA